MGQTRRGSTARSGLYFRVNVGTALAHFWHKQGILPSRRRNREGLRQSQNSRTPLFLFWRERVGIEPTQRYSRNTTTVLKTAAATRHASAPANSITTSLSPPPPSPCAQPVPPPCAQRPHHHSAASAQLASDTPAANPSAVCGTVRHPSPRYATRSTGH